MQTTTLTTDRLRSLAPSIFAATPWERVSSNYRFVPTHSVLDILSDMGFYPTMAAQSRCRIPGKADFTKHLIRLRHRDYLDAPKDDMPELVLVNSHDRSSAYKFYSGIFRMVCQNGMIVASEDFGSIAVKHSGARDLTQQIIDTTQQIAENAPKALAKIETFKQVTLRPAHQLAFASAALELRDGTAKIEPQELLVPRRREDAPDGEGNRTLWQTLNVAQETLIRGGARGRSTSGRRMTTRPIKAVDGDVRTNRALWVLAEQMAKLV
jgi:hypothetical protein